jgi:hypothetical protein
MTTLQQKYDWLQIVFTDRHDCDLEAYYFDRTDNVFFSVFVPETWYGYDEARTEIYGHTIEEHERFIKKVERLENGDADIIRVPQLTLEDRKTLLQDFLYEEQIQDIAFLQKFVEDENGKSALNFDNKLNTSYKAKWEVFKAKFVGAYIDNFCLNNDIQLETATIFSSEKVRKLNNELRPEVDTGKLLLPNRKE